MSDEPATQLDLHRTDPDFNRALAAWLPATNPPGELFFGVNRDATGPLGLRTPPAPWHLRARVWFARHVLRLMVDP